MPNIKKVTILPNYYFFLNSYYHLRYFLKLKLVYNKVFILLLYILLLIDTKLQELKIKSNDNSNRDECSMTKVVFQEMSYISYYYNAFYSLRKIIIIAYIDDVDN